MRLGIFNSGIHWQEFGFRRIGVSYQLLYIYEKDWDLNSFDILVVPKGIHQQFLTEASPQLQEWLGNGGVLICFGEIDGNWLPGTVWNPSIGVQYPTLTNDKHEIFAGLNDDDIAIWSKVGHGYFSKTPPNSEILIQSKQNPEQVIAFIDRGSFNGIILAMTLDPEYHTYTESLFARRLLGNVISWALSQSMQLRIANPRTRHKDLRHYFNDVITDHLTIRVLVSVGVGIAFGLVAYFLK